MGIKQILRGAGNGVGDIIKFDNGNTAQMSYVVGDDGGPSGAATITYVPPSGGIVDTTAVTLMAAVAGKTNTLTRMTVTNGSATGSEIALRNGSGGAVLWRGYASANSTNTYTPNVSASPGALLEFVAFTAAAAIYVTNIQGSTS